MSLKKRLLGGTTHETVARVGAENTLRQQALESGDLLTWLYVLEFRSWPTWDIKTRSIYRERYLVDYWAHGDGPLKSHLASLEEGDERDNFVRKLSEIYSAATPFIQHHRIKQDVQPAVSEDDGNKENRHVRNEMEEGSGADAPREGQSERVAADPEQEAQRRPGEPAQGGIGREPEAVSADNAEEQGLEPTRGSFDPDETAQG